MCRLLLKSVPGAIMPLTLSVTRLVLYTLKIARLTYLLEFAGYPLRLCTLATIVALAVHFATLPVASRIAGAEILTLPVE
jgi:hypothetical protein